MAALLIYYYPLVMALVFLAGLFSTNVPAKGAFFLRAMVALMIAVFLAHVNRLFDLWPSHLLFPSGHMTFCLGVALSLGMLRPWTLAITLPLVVVLGVCMVILNLHSTLDILGAFPLALIVYGLVHWFWPVSPDSAKGGFDGGKAAEAIKWYRKAAEQGLAHAQFNLGRMYDDGQGVTQDYAQALTWYLKAADQGDAGAQNNLGLMYAKGRGVSRDYTQARTWYLKAARQGHVIAEFNLGLMNLMGEGMTRDYTEALAWFIVASSSGNTDAAAKRNKLEAALGIQAAMLAHQRSKEILKDIERSKAQSGSVG